MILNELSHLCIWNEMLDITVLSFVFLVGGTITQIFGFSYWVPLVMFESWSVPACTVSIRTVALGLPCSSFCIWAHCCLESWPVPACTVSIRTVAPGLPCSSFCICAHCCLASAVPPVVTGMAGSCLMSRIPWVTGLAAVTGGGRPGGITIGQLPPLCVWCYKMHRICHCKWRGRGCSHGHLRVGGAGSSPHCPIPCGQGVAVEWMLDTTFPTGPGFSEAVDSAATVRGLGLRDTDSAVPLVPAPPCVSVLPPLGVYGLIHCEILWHPVVLGRGTF